MSTRYPSPSDEAPPTAAETPVTKNEIEPTPAPGQVVFSGGGSTVESHRDKITAQLWADKKGMGNRFVDGVSAFAQPNPLYQDFAMARAHAGWADDTTLTEEEFDAAVAAAKTHEFR